MNTVSEQFKQLQNEGKHLIEQAKNLTDLETIRIDLLGRKGKLASLMVILKDLSLEEKRTLGPLANQVKTELENLFAK